MISKALFVIGVSTATITGVIATAGSPPVASEVGLAALATLNLPSRPTALVDSVVESVGRYRATTDCEGVRAAYVAADAPVPADSTVVVDDAGVVQITSPFSTSAVIGDDTDGLCQYAVATSPTAEISGGATPAVAAYVPVWCQSVLGFSIFAAELPGDNGPQTVLATLAGDSGGPDDWKVLGAPGTIDELIANKVSEDEITLQLTGKGTLADGGVTVNADTGEVVRLTCTPSRPLTT